MHYGYVPEVVRSGFKETLLNKLREAIEHDFEGFWGEPSTARLPTPCSARRRTPWRVWVRACACQLTG